jgi:hypothetical protein
VSDFFILAIGLSDVWTYNVLHVDFKVRSAAFCKLFAFSVFTLAETSAWFLVAMTCQRVTSVLWPLRAASQSTTRAVVVVMCVVVASLLINSWLLAVLTVLPDDDGHVCTIDLNSTSTSTLIWQNVFLWEDLIVSTLLPFVILVFSNALLILKIRQSSKVARGMTWQGQGGTATRRRSASSLTVTVVITSVAFLVLTLPFPAYTYFRKTSAPVWASQTETTSSALQLQWYCNAGVNFYLYCLSGTKFRRTSIEVLMSLFRCRHGQTGRN